MGLDRPRWRALRARLVELLAAGADQAQAANCLLPLDQAEMQLPARVGDFTDFYASVYHATNVGSLFRPDNPLLPNYKWLPIGYHGRASSLVVSGTPVKRPSGQLKAADAPAPTFGPSRSLDYEMEVGFFVGGPVNPLGQPVPIGLAEERIFGLCLVNDWSARDVQPWEYQPLGPFLAKSFATTISPWIVTLDALEPFRCPAFPRVGEDPRPRPYLLDDADQQRGGYAIGTEMYLSSAQMRAKKLAPVRLSKCNLRDAYWTPAQIVAHQASNGCNLQPGDLLASGTISGTEPGSAGSLLELSQGGRQPIALPGGETRAFIADGDLVVQRGRCEAEGAVPIGFGEAAGLVRPAPK
jgi:fumarylacetoacetase